MEESYSWRQIKGRWGSWYCFPGRSHPGTLQETKQPGYQVFAVTRKGLLFKPPPKILSYFIQPQESNWCVWECFFLSKENIVKWEGHPSWESWLRNGRVKRVWLQERSEKSELVKQLVGLKNPLCHRTLRDHKIWTTGWISTVFWGLWCLLGPNNPQVLNPAGSQPVCLVLSLMPLSKPDRNFPTGSCS